MNNRILQFLSAENISQAQFADNIGVARASISHILSGRNKPGYDFIVNTMKRYPNLNIEWLLTGRGKMYKESERKDPYSNLFDNDSTSLDTTSFNVRSNSDESENPASTPFDVDDDGKQVAREVNIETPTESGNIDGQPKQIATQRKVTKVILFFNDSTFQEF